MPRHIIHKQTVTLEMAGSKDSNLFQDKVSHLLRNDLNGAMATIFDKMSGNGEVIRIDTLRLDLGEIRPTDFEAEFKSRLIEELTRLLLKNQGDTISNARAAVLKPVESLMEMLQYFLASGRLPWYAGPRRMSEWEAEILEKFGEKEWQILAGWIAVEYAAYRAVIERLIRQLSDKFIIAFLSGSYFRRDWLAEPGLIYDDLIVLIKTITKEKPADLRLIVWTGILAGIIEGKPFIQVLQDTIRKIARIAPASAITSTLKKKDWQIVFKSKTAKKAMTALFEDAVFIHDLEKRTEKGIKPAAKNASQMAENNSAPEKEPGTKKNDQKRRRMDDDEDFIFVQNCGVIILAPFLKPYFADLGLLNNKEFVDDDAQKRAVLLLHYLATGSNEAAEFDLTLQKVLCGLPIDEPLPNEIELSEKERSETEELLKAITQHWKPLNNTSVEGLRATFLQREGKMKELGTDWKLQVETQTVDVLLDKLPWGYSTIMLPWLKYMIHVEWY